MQVSEIYPKIKAVLGSCTPDLVFDYISDAVDALKNKGQWDPTQAYIDIQGDPNSNFLILPDIVEAPLRLNINKKPAFSKSKFYEFAQNSDGTVLGDTLGWTWDDRGEVPYSAFPIATTFQVRASLAGAVRVYGLDAANQNVFDSAGVEGYEPTTSLAGPVFSKITAVHKNSTQTRVSLYAGAQEIASYDPREYNPLYRVIKLSKSSAAIRMLFRRKTYRVQSLDDWIPLNSRLAITLMTQAVILWNKGQQPEVAAVYEAKAEALCKEEQEARNAFTAISDSSEINTIRNQTYLTADAIIVGDIYDDASDIFGAVSKEKVFDRVSDAIDLLSSKCNWDGMTGTLDICCANDCEYTLPDFVETVLKVNFGGLPTLGQNKWFEFHLNGPGSCSNMLGYGQWTWGDKGSYPTFKDIKRPSQLVVSLSDASDNNIQIRVKGWNEKGERVYTDGQDGYVPPAVYGVPMPDVNCPRFSRIESIRAESEPIGYLKVSALDVGTPEGTLLTILEPGQVQTNFRRIRVPGRIQTIRVLFRKKTRRVRSYNDLIPLSSKMAIIMAMKAVNAYKKDDVESGMAFEQTATRILEEEQNSRNPQADFPIEIEPYTSPGSQINMR